MASHSVSWVCPTHGVVFSYLGIALLIPLFLVSEHSTGVRSLFKGCLASDRSFGKAYHVFGGQFCRHPMPGGRVRLARALLCAIPFGMRVWLAYFYSCQELSILLALYTGLVLQGD
jgi:hypothetical protein